MTDVKAILGCRYGWFIVCLFVFIFLKVFMNIGENVQKDVKWCESENWCSYPSGAVGENINISGNTKDKSTVHFLSV